MPSRENENITQIEYEEGTSVEIKGDKEASAQTEEKLFDAHQTHHHHHHSHTSHSHSASSKKHHRSHRSSRDRKKETRKEAFESFIRHNKKYLLYSAGAILIFVCLTMVGQLLDKQGADTEQTPGDTSNSGISITTDNLQISVPFFAEDVVTVGAAADAYIKAEANVHVRDIYKKYYVPNSRLDIGVPVELSYEISGLPEGQTVAAAEFIVADNVAFNNPYVISASRYETKVDVYNLKTGVQYYYKIHLTFSSGIESSITGSFRTASGPRIMYVDGAFNMRDIGGWTTSAGKEIKQGLLYRGCELDGAVESQYTIAQSGVNTMLTVLGIKTDMDLRAPSDNKYGTDSLGAGVKHIYYSAPMYSAIFDTAEGAESMRKVFSDLADESNYPVYLHCTYGQDRTGTVCYLLEALLGLDEESLMKEYQLSGLHHGDVDSDSMSEMIGRLKALEGTTMSEKVEAYLLSVGVTKHEIAAIRSIFLKD